MERKVEKDALFETEMRKFKEERTSKKNLPEGVRRRTPPSAADYATPPPSGSKGSAHSEMSVEDAD